MHTGDSLLAAIEAFCALHGMSETAFGQKVARDGHLVRRLREERSITLKRIDKAEKFMAEYGPAGANTPDLAPADGNGGESEIPSRVQAA